MPFSRKYSKLLLQEALPKKIVINSQKFKVWEKIPLFFSSVQFNHSVVSDSLWPHEPQHARPPCPSLTPRVHPNPYPLSWWCHPTISSSVVPFSSCPQSFPASESFPMSQLFTSGGQILEFHLQHQSFQWTSKTDLLKDGLVGCPCSPRDSIAYNWKLTKCPIIGDSLSYGIFI